MDGSCELLEKWADTFVLKLDYEALSEMRC